MGDDIEITLEDLENVNHYGALINILHKKDTNGIEERYHMWLD